MARWTSDAEKQKIWEQAEARIMALGEAAKIDPDLQTQVRITFTGRDDSGRFDTKVSAEGPLWQAMRDCVIDCFHDLDPYPDRYLDEEVTTIGNAFGLTCLIMESLGAHGYDLKIRRLPRKRQLRRIV